MNVNGGMANGAGPILQTTVACCAASLTYTSLLWCSKHCHRHSLLSARSQAARGREHAHPAPLYRYSCQILRAPGARLLAQAALRTTAQATKCTEADWALPLAVLWATSLPHPTDAPTDPV